VVYSPFFKEINKMADSEIVYTMNNVAMPQSIIFPASPNGFNIKELEIETTTSATVGNRQIRIDVLNASDVSQSNVLSSSVQTAGKTIIHRFGKGYTNVSDSKGVHTSLAGLINITTGYKLKVSDSAGIDAAGDRVNIYFKAERA
jgi:hypothetical protein